MNSAPPGTASWMDASAVWDGRLLNSKNVAAADSSARVHGRFLPHGLDRLYDEPRPIDDRSSALNGRS
jgi:hypothetical protein